MASQPEIEEHHAFVEAAPMKLPSCLKEREIPVARQRSERELRISTDTVQDIEKKVAAVQQANPNWAASASVKALLTSLHKCSGALQAQQQRVPQFVQTQPLQTLRNENDFKYAYFSIQKIDTGFRTDMGKFILQHNLSGCIKRAKDRTFIRVFGRSKATVVYIDQLNKKLRKQGIQFEQLVEPPGWLVADKDNVEEESDLIAILMADAADRCESSSGDVRVLSLADFSNSSVPRFVHALNPATRDHLSTEPRRVVVHFPDESSATVDFESTDTDWSRIEALPEAAKRKVNYVVLKKRDFKSPADLVVNIEVDVVFIGAKNVS